MSEESAAEFSSTPVVKYSDSSFTSHTSMSGDKECSSKISQPLDIWTHTVAQQSFGDHTGKLSFHNTNDYIFMHNSIVSSGKYNFEGCKFSLDTNLNLDYFRFMLSDYHDHNLCDLLEFGFPIGYMGKIQQQSRDNYSFVKNHKGAKDYAVHVQKFLNKELQFDAILGPFRENPFNCNVCISPLNTVPKKDSEERRIILDLSYPKGNSINDFVSKDFYLGQRINLTYPGVDDLVAIVKTKGRGCLLFKRDLSRAYRQLSLDPGDASLLGYSFNGFMYFDKVLSFGLRSAAYFMQRVSNSVKFICNILNILIENYLDDLAGADSPDKAWQSFTELGNVLQFCGLKESVEKCSPPSTKMVFIGVLFDSISLTLSITDERLNEIRSLVSQWLQKREATLRELQSLIGKLNFVAHCVKPARIFISRLLNWLRRIQNTESPQVIPLETKKNLIWWLKFLPKYNGISMMDLEEWSEPDEFCATDACLVGAGGIFADCYFHCEFPDFIRKANLHINNLELLTIVIAVKLWGHLWKGKKLVLNCDNKSSVLVLNSGSSRDSFSQSCLREICFFAAVYQFQIKGVFISGSENRIPNFLSRWNLNKQYQEQFHAAVGHHLRAVSVPDHLFAFIHDW